MKKEIAILSAALILLTGCASKTDTKNVPAEPQGGLQVLDADPVATTTTDEDMNPNDDAGEAVTAPTPDASETGATTSDNSEINNETPAPTNEEATSGQRTTPDEPTNTGTPEQN